MQKYERSQVTFSDGHSPRWRLDPSDKKTFFIYDIGTEQAGRKHLGYTVFCKSFYLATPNFKFHMGAPWGNDSELGGGHVPPCPTLATPLMCEIPTWAILSIQYKQVQFCTMYNNKYRIKNTNSFTHVITYERVVACYYDFVEII